MLLSSSQVITRSQPQEESSLRGKIEEEPSMVRRKVEELKRSSCFGWGFYCDPWRFYVCLKREREPYLSSIALATVVDACPNSDH
jgi:hypothetical protein